MDREDAPGGLVHCLVVVAIEVLCAHEHGQVVVLSHQSRVGEKEVGVCFQVNYAAVNKEAAVTLHKVC